MLQKCSYLLGLFIIAAILCGQVSTCEAPDTDGDGITDPQDNCPELANPFQTDQDGDRVGDDCDNCEADSNKEQSDTDADGIGDICDNCPKKQNNKQLDCDVDGIGDECDTENSSCYQNNILTSDKVNTFVFSNSHSAGFAGDPRYVSDEIDRETTSSWTSYGFQQSIGSGTGWWKVDLLKEYTARYIVVVGYPGGSHYPKDWWLEGSNDNNTWIKVHTFSSSPDGSKPPADWHLHSGTGSDGKSWNDVKDKDSGYWVAIDNPGKYRYYRIIGTGWNISNGYMLLMNVGLFVEDKE